MEIIRVIPRDLRDDDLAVTWTAIEDRALHVLNLDPARFRLALQYHYFIQYLREYKAVVLRSVPFARSDFGLAGIDLRYDYELFRLFMQTCGLWNIVRHLSAAAIILMRTKLDFINFRAMFDAFAVEARTLGSAKFVIAYAVQQISSKWNSSFTVRIQERVMLSGPRGLELDNASVEEIAKRLADVVGTALATLRELIAEHGDLVSTPSIASSKIFPHPIKPSQTMKKVAIFVALREEFEILETLWKLSRVASKGYSSGRLANVEVYLYSARAMGRVPAALATYEFLAEMKPDCLICTGIAGGFIENKAFLGAVLVPKIVFDLASRKIREVDKSLETEFRQEPFQTDTRLVDFIDKGDFDKKAWQTRVAVETGFPEGTHPVIRFEPVASLDDVVASDKWRKTLLAKESKLAGVEMEAGGVCAAAQRFKLSVVVVRGVSDLADPVKSDTEWRRRALLTVADLITRFVGSNFFIE